eukprot:1118197-Lingulodinium_polyedra.AAC.1
MRYIDHPQLQRLTNRTFALSTRAPENSRAREARGRAVCEALRSRTVDSTASLCSILQTLRNDAVASLEVRERAISGPSRRRAVDSTASLRS